MRPPQQFLEDHGACVLQTCRGIPARLGTQQSCPSLGRKVGPTTRPGKLEPRMILLVSTGSIIATVLYGLGEGALQRCVLGRKGRRRASGSQLSWCLRAPKRLQSPQLQSEGPHLAPGLVTGLSYGRLQSLSHLSLRHLFATLVVLVQLV